MSGGPPLRLLVVRPQPGADRTAERLRAAGHRALVLPLSEIVPMAVVLPPADSFGVLAATSANAFRALPQCLPDGYAERPIHVVGEASAEAARRAGFRQVLVASGDVESLAEALVGARPGALLYLAGRIRRPTLEERLRQAGIAVRTLETYDRIAIEPDRADRERLGGERIDGILLTSVLDAERFETFAASMDVFRKTVRLCLSPRIAEVAGKPFRIARDKSADALVELVATLR